MLPNFKCKLKTNRCSNISFFMVYLIVPLISLTTCKYSFDSIKSIEKVCVTCFAINGNATRVKHLPCIKETGLVLTCSCYFLRCCSFFSNRPITNIVEGKSNSHKIMVLCSLVKRGSCQEL